MNFISLSWKLSIILAIAGIALSLYLVQYHYELKTGQSGWCDINSFINCNNIILSSYSEFADIPLGIFGAAWFFVFLFLRLSGRFQIIPRWLKENSKELTILWCVLGLSLVSLLVYIELGILRSICIICTSAHMLVLSISLLTFLELRQSK